MIICCGEALIDMVETPVPPGGAGFLPVPGGCPFNTAIAAGRLGADARFLGRISTDFFGETLAGRLLENNVGCDMVIRCGRNSTLAFVKTEPGKEPRYVFYTEGSADGSFSAGDLPPSLPPETSCVFFGSVSMTIEPSASAFETLVFREAARKDAGKPVIAFDPNIRPFMIKDRDAYIKRFQKWAAASTIVKLSDADLEFIYPSLDTEAALEKLLATGPALVIGTTGPRGAVALLKRGGGVVRIREPAVPVAVVDTIGAGDTFHGAFLTRLELGGKMSPAAIADLDEACLRDALRFANRAAAIVCSRRGADPPTSRELAEKFDG